MRVEPPTRITSLSCKGHDAMPSMSEPGILMPECMKSRTKRQQWPPALLPHLVHAQLGIPESLLYRAPAAAQKITTNLLKLGTGQCAAEKKWGRSSKATDFRAKPIAWRSKACRDTCLSMCLGPSAVAVMKGKLIEVWVVADSSTLAFSAASVRLHAHRSNKPS